MSEGQNQRDVRGEEHTTPGQISAFYAGLNCSQTRTDRDLLKEIISEHVVPRLVVAEQAAHRQSAHLRGSGPPTENQISELLHIVIEADTPSCIAFLRDLREHGMQLENVYLGLLSPVARQLGTMWETDRISFIDVTVALARLQSLVHELTREECFGALQFDETRRIVLARAEGEQHAFGLLIVAEFLRLAGWDVTGGSEIESGRSLSTIVKASPFCVAGLAAGSVRHAAALKDDIRALREQSRNDAIGVIVGGPAFVQDPALGRFIGADATARDGREAVLHAEPVRASGSRKQL